MNIVHNRKGNNKAIEATNIVEVFVLMEDCSERWYLAFTEGQVNGYYGLGCKVRG